jgi:pyruvate/oxaloacetate carboxyltransferase
MHTARHKTCYDKAEPGRGADAFSVAPTAAVMTQRNMAPQPTHTGPCSGAENALSRTPHTRTRPTHFFHDMPTMNKHIDITELALRDAHQSLLATRMAMEDMVPACADIDAAGFWSVECWGGATFDACIRFLNEDPWQRLRTFRQLMPSSRLQMLLRGQNLLGYRHYEDSVVDRFVDKAAENGMDVFRVFDALNDLRNVAHSIKAVRRNGKHAQGTICYTVSPLHTVQGYVDMARGLVDMGCDSLCIKDMAALLRVGTSTPTPPPASRW